MEQYEVIGYVFAAIVTIAGGIGTLYKVMSAMRKEREFENEKILKQAHEYVDQKYKILDQEIAHQKDMNEGKIAELSQKIEDLRKQMENQHTQLVGLLTKMVVEKD